MPCTCIIKTIWKLGTNESFIRKSTTCYSSIRTILHHTNYFGILSITYMFLSR
jgi:hypothetical protein